MGIHFRGLEFQNLNELNTSLLNAKGKVEFHFLRGRKFVLSDQVGHTKKVSLNEVLKALRENMYQYKSTELEKSFEECKKLKETGYETLSENKIKGIFLNFKHKIGTRERRKISTSLNQSIAFKKSEENPDALLKQVLDEYRGWETGTRVDKYASFTELDERLEIISDTSTTTGRTLPDERPLGNILINLTPAPNVFLIPTTTESGPPLLNEEYIRDTLSPILNAAFSSGKYEMVVGRFSNPKHAFTCVFTAKGEFFIIDSLVVDGIKYQSLVLLYYAIKYTYSTNVKLKIQKECLLNSKVN